MSWKTKSFMWRGWMFTYYRKRHTYYAVLPGSEIHYGSLRVIKARIKAGA
jgi:hypothetical protein